MSDTEELGHGGTNACLDGIVTALTAINDPAARFIACVDIYNQLHATIKQIGPSGVRGKAAQALIRTEGSAAKAAKRVRALGGTATGASAKELQRIAERVSGA